MKQPLSFDQLKRRAVQTSIYAHSYVQQHEKHLRAEYPDVILAIEEGKGVVGFDGDINELVRTTTLDMQTRPLSVVVYGRVDDFLDAAAHIDMRVGGYR